MSMSKDIIEAMKLNTQYSPKDISLMVFARECLAKTFLEMMVDAGKAIKHGNGKFERIK